jgi:hypothetical protein
MSVSLSCPGCGKGLRVKEEWAGRHAKCPTCGAAVLVPSAGESAREPVAAKTGAAVRRGTVYDPAAAAAAKAARTREAAAGGDRNLPWQYVLLGFLGFPAILACTALIFSFIPGPGRSPSTNAFVQQITIPYLALVAVSAPILIKTGRRRFKTVNKTATPPLNRASRIVLGVIMILAGMMMWRLGYSVRGYVFGGGAIGAGIGLILSALLADS